MGRTGRVLARVPFFIGPLGAWPVAAGQWPQFRGPGASGVAVDDPRLPDTWTVTDNVAWSIGIPGRGWSSRWSGVITSSSSRLSTPGRSRR